MELSEIVAQVRKGVPLRAVFEIGSVVSIYYGRPFGRIRAAWSLVAPRRRLGRAFVGCETYRRTYPATRLDGCKG